jgi:hypothetical protein
MAEKGIETLVKREKNRTLRLRLHVVHFQIVKRRSEASCGPLEVGPVCPTELRRMAKHG